MATVHLVSDSSDYDASLVSLADAVAVCAKVRRWFVVGGHMVNLHILRAGLDLPLRLTRDADLAVPLRVIMQGDLVDRLHVLGYRTVHYPNRFEKDVAGLTASIDLLVASYSTKHRPNIDGDRIVVDGMPVVDEALAREPEVVELIADRTDGVRMAARVRIPDILSAIAMKSFAVAERSNPDDASDLASLLEVARAQGHHTARWPKGRAFVAAIAQLSAQFDAPGAALALATPDIPRQARLREITRSLAGTSK